MANKKTVQKNEEKQELIEIYNNLTPSVKSQLMTTARIIQTTQNIVLSDKKKKRDNI